MRSVLETAMYYSYFRTHHAELETLARNDGYYVDKSDILEFHKEHTRNFMKMQEALGLLSRLNSWYGKVSSLVHGQVPGAWIEHTSVKDIKPIKITQDLAIQTFTEGVEVVHRFLLCTTGKQLWDTFSPSSKKFLLSGLHGNVKKTLQLELRIIWYN